MANSFIRVNCKDCGQETILFSRATTQVICSTCSATLTKSTGGKSELVGCQIVEYLD